MNDPILLLYLGILCYTTQAYFFSTYITRNLYNTYKRISQKTQLRDGLLNSIGISEKSIFGDSLDKLAANNAELLAIKEQNEILGKKTGGIQSLTKIPLKIMQNKPSTVSKLLARDGVISISNVLPDDMCDDLLGFINYDNNQCKQEVLDGKVNFDDRFGGVNCRGQQGIFGLRQDQYLPMSSPIVKQCMTQVLMNLYPLLQQTVESTGMIHEFSSFVADPKAPRQCIHADTIVLPCPQYPMVSMEPLYTIFIALQDVSNEMGHTQFLPQTHTAEAHLLWNVDQRKKELFLEKQKVVQSSLLRGDVSIFDSRVLHCGCANSSTNRRVLAYLTISKQQRWPLPNGLHGSNSIRTEDRWKYRLCDLVLNE